MFTFTRTYTRPNTSVPFLHDAGNQTFNDLAQSIRTGLVPGQNGFIGFIDTISPDGLVKSLGLSWADQSDQVAFMASVSPLIDAYENMIQAHASANNIDIDTILTTHTE